MPYEEIGKVTASIFWDRHGVIMVDYLENGHAINGEDYAAAPGDCEEMKRKVGSIFQPITVTSSWSVYLTMLFLGRLCPLSS